MFTTSFALYPYKLCKSSVFINLVLFLASLYLTWHFSGFPLYLIGQFSDFVIISFVDQCEFLFFLFLFFRLESQFLHYTLQKLVFVEWLSYQGCVVVSSIIVEFIVVRKKVFYNKIFGLFSPPKNGICTFFFFFGDRQLGICNVLPKKKIIIGTQEIKSICIMHKTLTLIMLSKFWKIK